MKLASYADGAFEEMKVPKESTVNESEDFDCEVSTDDKCSHLLCVKIP